jgi:hypothetical protein
VTAEGLPTVQFNLLKIPPFVGLGSLQVLLRLTTL